MPPATPLVACDPYFSIWSQSPNITDVDTTHWTGKSQRLTSHAVVDGKAYRLIGLRPSAAPSLKQKSQQVTPTRSIYVLEGAGVEVTLTFMTPALPEDIDLLSRPITYLTYDVRSIDGRQHSVRLYFDASGELTVNTPDQQVVSAIEKAGDLTALKIGSEEQPILGKTGDDLRIDWGYLYVAAPQKSLAGAGVGSPEDLRKQFAASTDGALKSAAGQDAQPADKVAAALSFNLGKVGDKLTRRWLVLAYDDIYSIDT